MRPSAMLPLGERPSDGLDSLVLQACWNVVFHVVVPVDVFHFQEFARVIKGPS